jgi:hypothetical protein
MALLWHRAEDQPKARRQRLDDVFRALNALGAAVEPIVYAEDLRESVREQLRRVDGVLVWVNPITEGSDRAVLDSLLREASAAGVWVSAHPDVIDILGTKEVLCSTRELGWGSDVQLYADVATLRSELPRRLAAGPRVLKRTRGNAGIGVWKVQLMPGAVTVHVQHAHDGAAEVLALDDALRRFAIQLAGGGRLVEQPFVPRSSDGMVRCYLSGDRVVGFSEHACRSLAPGVSSSADETARPSSGKTMYGSAAPAFRALRVAMETDWLPGMQRVLQLEAEALPAIWDVDFLRGPIDVTGDDTWVLCEVNVSCVSPYPEEAAEWIARTAVDRVKGMR